MLGSLQEFIDHVQSYPITINHQSITHPSSESNILGIDQRNIMESKAKLGEGKTKDFKGKLGSIFRKSENGENMEHVNTIRYNAVKKLMRMQTQETMMNKVSKTYSLRKNKPRHPEYIVSDKSDILQKHHQLSNDKNRQHNNTNMALLKENLLEKASQRTDTSQILKLKGKLKYEHQLLRSIIRVEQFNQMNPRSLFELSFKSMSQGLRNIKVYKNISKNVAKMDDNDDIIQMLKNQSKVTKRDHLIVPQKNKTKISNKRRILLQGNLRWAKSRAKSTESYEQKLGHNYTPHIERLHSEIKERRAIFKKIDSLISQPQKVYRKNSIKYNPKMFN